MNLNSKIENQKRGGKDTTPLSDIKEYVDGGVKEYVALLTQTGTDAPVATVLKNTLGGEVVWTRDDVGVYAGTLSNTFTVNKTAVFQNLPSKQYADEIIINVVYFSNDVIRIYNFNDGFSNVDSFDFLSIKIEVYP